MTEANKRAFDISLCTIAFRERLLEYSLDLAAEVGFQGVEIWGREPHISAEYDKNRVNAAARMVRERGLTVPVFGSYLRVGATNTDDVFALKDALRIAAGLEVPVMRIWASDVGSADASESLWARTIDEAGEAAACAAKMGIRLAIEMHGNTLCDTGASTCRLLEAVRSDSLGANYQVSSKERDETALERMKLVLPWVMHMHAQNYAPLQEGSDRVERVALADGVVEYGPLFDLLRAHNYEGVVSVEFCAANATDKRAAIAHDYRYLRSL